MPPRELGESRTGISRLAKSSHVSEESLDPRWGCDPRDLEQPGACIAQAESGSVGQAQRHPRHKDHRGPGEHRSSLPLMDKERLIPDEISVEGNRGSWGKRECSHREWGAASPRIDGNGELTTQGRAQLQDFAPAGLMRGLHGWVDVLLLRFARALLTRAQLEERQDCEDAGDANQRVDRSHEPRCCAEERLHEIIVEEPHEPPIDRANRDQHPDELAHQTTLASGDTPLPLKRRGFSDHRDQLTT